MHYILEEDAEAHDILLCIQTNKQRDDEGRFRFPSEDYWLKSEEEMRTSTFLWEDGRSVLCPPEIIDKAIANVKHIADSCNVEIEFHNELMPVFEVPEGYTTESYLEYKCKAGLWEYALESGINYEEYLKQLDYELDVIITKGYAGYFLIVADIVQWAKSQGIPVGPGRGSAAGCLISYTLGITGIDPLKHGMVFERFLNPERASAPDIDLDFDESRRKEVIEYITNRYGNDHVAQIGTFGTLAAKNAVKRVARALGFTAKQAQSMADAVPEMPKITIARALEDSEALRQIAEKYPDVIRIAKRLEGLAANTSIHAAGVVIAPDIVTKYCPLMLGKDNEIVTQFSMDDIADLGLLKIDCLGLATLTVIDRAMRAAGLDYHEMLRRVELNDRLPISSCATKD